MRQRQQTGWSFGKIGREEEETFSAVDKLILKAASTDTQPGEEELGNIVTHVAEVGFDPIGRERAGGRLVGVFWRGRRLTASDLLLPAEVHFLRHPIAQAEWPSATSLERYLASLREVVEDPRSGLLVSRYHRQVWQLAVVRRSFELRGPGGGDWVVVEYRLEFGYWVTAFQPYAGLNYFESPQREQQRWLRRPV